MLAKVLCYEFPVKLKAIKIVPKSNTHVTDGGWCNRGGRRMP